MIGALEGTVFSNSTNPIILFCSGVGYEVSVPDRVRQETVPGNKLFLFVHSHIREDAFDLFGFTSKEELEMFRLLLSVSGIGPKTSLTVIDRGVKNVTDAVQHSDVEFFTGIPRLGKKNAQKIIIELKQKLGSLNELDLSGNESGQTAEILDALMGMGFPRPAILSVLKHIPAQHTTVEQKIRYCIAHLGTHL